MMSTPRYTSANGGGERLFRRSGFAVAAAGLLGSRLIGAALSHIFAESYHKYLFLFIFEYQQSL